MKLTLLLDLDDTLVKNDIEAFLPQYLPAFSAHVANYLNPDLFVRSLMAGTRAMVENRRPDRTLKETFELVFYPLTGTEQVMFQGLADDFYESIFPSLSIIYSSHSGGERPGPAGAGARAIS